MGAPLPVIGVRGKGTLYPLPIVFVTEHDTVQPGDYLFNTEQQSFHLHSFRCFLHWHIGAFLL